MRARILNSTAKAASPINTEIAGKISSSTSTGKSQTWCVMFLVAACWRQSCAELISVSAGGALLRDSRTVQAENTHTVAGFQMPSSFGHIQDRSVALHPAPTMVERRHSRCTGMFVSHESQRHCECACAYRAVRQEDDGLAVGKIADRSNVQGEKTQGNGAHGLNEGHDAGCGRVPDEAVFDFLRSKSAEERIRQGEGEKGKWKPEPRATKATT